MSFIDVKDRIPTEVLNNGAVRYGVYDENRNLLRYEYMKREDEPIEEGTPVNKVLFNEMYGMDNYEQISLTSQDDISELTTSNNIVGQIDSGNGSNNWVGHSINKLDPNVWDFNMKSWYSGALGSNMYLTSSYGSNYTAIAVTPMINSKSSTSLSDFNANLARTAYVSGYYTIFASYIYNTFVYMDWDFKRPCTPVFHGRTTRAGTSSSYYGSAFLSGSNDNINWERLSSINGIVDYTVTTPYRYFRLEILLSGGGIGSNNVSKLELYYSYFTNVADTIAKYRNNFTAINDFTIKECANVIIPSYENDGYITENTINDIPVDVLLGKNMPYKLRYDGEKIVSNTGARVVTGNFTSNDDLVMPIDVGFKPDLVIIYNAMNNSQLYVASSDTGVCYGGWIPRILTQAYSYPGGGEITDNGFTFRPVANKGGTTYYMAIQF